MGRKCPRPSKAVILLILFALAALCGWWDCRTNPSWDVVHGLAFTPDGTTLIAGTIGGKLQVWDVATGDLVWADRSLPKYPRSMVLSHSGTQLAWVGTKSITMIDLTEGRQRPLPGNDATFLISSAAFSRGDKALLVDSSRFHQGATLTKYDVPSGRIIDVWTDLPNGFQYILAFHQSDRFLQCGGHKVAIRDDGTTEATVRLDIPSDDPPVKAVALSSDDRCLATGDKAGNVRVWQTGTWVLLGHWKIERGFVNSVALSADGRTLGVGSAGGVVRWFDVKTKRGTTLFDDYRVFVDQVAISPDGNRVAADLYWGDRLGSHLMVWDTSTGAMMQLY